MFKTKSCFKRFYPGNTEYCSGFVGSTLLELPEFRQESTGENHLYSFFLGQAFRTPLSPGSNCYFLEGAVGTGERGKKE